MYIELTKQLLLWKIKGTLKKYKKHEKGYFNEVNDGIEQLLHGAENCKEMIDNRRKISDSEFYRMLNTFASVTRWSKYDRDRVLELAYNMKFSGEDFIKTTMYYEYMIYEGNVFFRILYTKDFELKLKHIYTVDEIKRLVAEKKIIILTMEVNNNFYFPWKEDYYEKEKYQEFDYALNRFSMPYDFLNEDGKFYKYTLKYIRKQLSNKKLKELFNEYLEHVESEIYKTTSGNYDVNDSSWTNVAKEYSKEFEERGYAKRLTKLNGKK